jgi:magnesium chelatase family protein
MRPEMTPLPALQPQRAWIDVQAVGDTTLIPGVPGTTIRLSKVLVTAGGAAVLSLKEGRRDNSGGLRVATNGHIVLLLGPPGAGKSRLARRLTTILPAMTLSEAIETTPIRRVAGLTGARTAVVTTRPCRAPHRTVSDVGRIGGGHLPMPGEVSRAHHGMLFLDERPEFRRHVLEVLRQPLEESVM